MYSKEDMMKDERAALKAIELYQRSTGVEPEVIRHSPLHYNMADLVTGLMKLAAEKGLTWARVVADAKEGVAAK